MLLLLSSLIKKLEDVSKSNDIITPDSSDFDEPTPTFSSKKTKPFNLTIDVANEIIKKSPLVEPPHEEDGGDEGGDEGVGDETGQNTDGDETGQNTDGDETGQNIGEIVIDISSNEQ